MHTDSEPPTRMFEGTDATKQPEQGTADSHTIHTRLLRI